MLPTLQSSGQVIRACLLGVVWVCGLCLSGCTPGHAARQAQLQARLQRAEAAFRAGNLANARRDLDAVVQLAPLSAELHYLDARITEQLGESAAAERQYQAVLDLSPDYLPAYLSLAWLYIRDGVPERSLELLREPLQLHPADGRLLAVRAAALAALNPSAVLDNADTKALQGPGSSMGTAVATRAWLLERAGNPERAVQLLEAALRQGPVPDQLRLMLADLLAETGQPARAASQLIDLLNAPPAASRGPAAAMPVDEFQRTHALISLTRVAGGLAAAGQLDEASRAVSVVLRVAADNEDAHLIRAGIALKRYAPSEALAELRVVQRQEPRSAIVWQLLGRAEYADGQPAAAERALRTAMALAPTDPAPKLLLAELWASTNRADAAIGLLRQLVGSTPSGDRAVSAEATALLVDAELAGSHLAAADQDIARLAADPAYRRLATYLAGVVAERRGQIDQAIDCYARAHGPSEQGAPDDRALDAWTAWARLLVAQRRTTEALDRIGTLMHLHANNARIHDLLGQLYLADHQNMRAKAELATSMQLAPLWWRPYYDLASAQVAIGDRDGAIATLGKAIGLIGPHPSLVAELTAAHRNGG